MKTQSSYLYRNTSDGGGQLAVRSIDPLFYDGVIDLQPKVRPVSETVSKPQTGGPSPVISTAPAPTTEAINSQGDPAPFIQTQDEQLIINGTIRIPKKKAALIGGGAIGAALLLKYIL